MLCHILPDACGNPSSWNGLGSGTWNQLECGLSKVAATAPVGRAVALNVESSRNPRVGIPPSTLCTCSLLSDTTYLSLSGPAQAVLVDRDVAVIAGDPVDR